jgi:hypothetical protein
MYHIVLLIISARHIVFETLVTCDDCLLSFGPIPTHTALYL